MRQGKRRRQWLQQKWTALRWAWTEWNDKLQLLRSISYVWVVPPALLLLGIQGLYMAVVHRHQANYTMVDYLANRPSDKWLQLTDAAWDLSSVTYAKVPIIGIVTEVYIPVLAQETAQTLSTVQANEQNHNVPPCTLQPNNPQSIQLILITDHRQLIRMLQSTNVPDYRERDISGMVKVGVTGITSDTLRWLEDEYGDRLSEDVVFIELDARPNGWRSLAFFIAGSLMGKWLLTKRAE